MANQYSGPPSRNNGIDFEPDFYLPQNQYHPTTSSRSPYRDQLVEYTRILSGLTPYMMKLTVFVLIAAAGLMLGKPAVAEAPVLDQLASDVSIDRIIENMATSQAQGAVSAASSSAGLDQTPSDSASQESASSVTVHERSAPATAEERTSAARAEESRSAATVEERTSAATAEESTSAATAEERTSAATAEESRSAATVEETATDSTYTDNAIEESTSASSDQSEETWVYEGSTGCCIWPTRGRVTSRVTRWHTAIDIAAPYWTPVVAADGGRVIAAGWDRTGYGYRMIIDHGSGLSTLYAHLSRYYYDYGDYVNKGMIIGRVGSTGNSSGNHLHFEVRVHNYRQNPWNWLP